MFKKRPNVKNLAPLRSSDRRKVVDQIIADYEIEAPQLEPIEGQTEEQRQSSSLTALRNALLPEGAQSARFTTTVGAENRQVSGTVYAAQFPGEELRIYWFKLEEKIIPTVYTLWKHPKLVPLLHTPDIVLQKMRNGADLMTPGLARGPPFPEKAKKDAIAAVSSIEKLTVPIVVGSCEIDVSSLSEVQGLKGHAVRGIHWEGDELWGWSPSGRSAGLPAPKEISIASNDAEVNSTAEGIAAVDLQNRAAAKPTAMEHTDGAAAGTETGATAFEEVDKPKKIWTVTDIDAAFKNAFLYAVHEAKAQHRDSPTHGMTFPVQPSQFISSMVQPYLPIFDADDAAALQIKKSSWKNVRKFIKALDKEVLLKSKDRSGGETVILDIDFDDEQVTRFQPYRLPKKTSTASGPAEGNKTSNGTSDNTIGQKIQIVHLLKPHKTLQPVFTAVSADPLGLYLPTEIRKHMTSYIEKEELIQPNDKSQVKLNPILADALYATGTTSTNDYDAQQALVKGHVGRDALFTRAQTHACAAYHLVKRTPAGAAATDPATMAASLDRRAAVQGPPPRIKMTLETRSGNKTATRVSGLEPFGVAPDILAEALQKACASSTSVGPLVGSSPKKPVMEVMVQGPQRDAVVRLLEKHGVSKAWVDVTDKTKKKGGR